MLGYDEIRFKFNSKKFASAEDARDKLFDRLMDEFDHLYSIHQLNAYQGHQFSEMQELAERLMPSTEKTPFLTRWGRYWNEAKNIRTGLILLTQFESTRVFGRKELDEEFRRLSVKTELLMRSYIREARRGLYTYPIRGMTRIFSFLEGRRRKRVEVIFVLVAALLGAALGGALTALVGK